MKKTKILLVLAIAMLAMFAMSACGLVAQGIEKVEFEVMPKNYFVAEGFAGINVKFNATIAGSVYTVDYTADANVENEKVEIKAGVVEGEVFDAKELKVLATLPGKEGMVAMLLSVLQAPIRNIACAIKAVAEKE